ncbi:MAG: efflux RND transporter periplasmic adaptor subunit [Myxococcales bacterium]|nr:efflux RND transporter periplasmic adaptor subunit [Myxococcales bacterium]
MKRIVTFFLVLLFLLALAGTGWFLWSKSRTKPKIYETETAQLVDIVKKTVATGAIVPRREVEIKPRVSGVLDQLFVEPGKVVKLGDPIAKIRIVPNAAALNRAEADVRAAQIAFDNAKRELDRNQNLYTQGVVPEAELARYRTDFSLRQQELTAATSNLQIVRDGQSRASSKNSNVVVTSTVDGMIIDVPVKVGFSVIESNNFNPGSTIALVADMDDLIFQGQVDESEVGKIKEGMSLKIKIGAIESEEFAGKLEYIAPKGKEVQGAIQFEIRADITLKPGVFIRAGYSANADVVLAEVKQVLAIREAVVTYERAKGADPAKDGPGKATVEVETQPKVFVRRDVKLGVSDGVNVQVLAGVAKGDKLKIPDNAGPAKLKDPKAP